MASGPHKTPQTVINVPKLHTMSQGFAPCWTRPLHGNGWSSLLSPENRL